MVHKLGKLDLMTNRVKSYLPQISQIKKRDRLLAVVRRGI